MSILPKSMLLKDGSEVTIREATADDAAAIIEMIGRILTTAEFALTKPEEFKFTVEEEAAILEQYQHSSGSVYLIAELDGIFLGDIVFTNGKKQRHQHQGEFAMGVIPERRKLGIGSVLLETLLEWAEKNPMIKKVKLQVAIQNYNAIHLYRNHGFIEEGRFIKELRTDDGEFMDVLAMYKFV